MAFPAQPPSTDIPVCPRHPDRISYVRCQRCGRPACPECQRTAAVGMQCVDCVRETQGAARRLQGRGMYGGRPTSGRPAVTITIMAICVAVYLLQFIVPNNLVVRLFAYAPILTDVQPWRMLTSAFLHSQGLILHILFNLYALWILGRHLEPLLGRLRFALLYLISALGGSVGVLLLAAPMTTVIGASGAVFGLFGAIFIVQRQRGGDVRAILILLVINAVLGFVSPGIAWQAHLGGLVTGGLCALVLAYAPRGRTRSLLQFLGLALIVVLLLAATYVGFTQLVQPRFLLG